jgi:hypothetical protein
MRYRMQLFIACGVDANDRVLPLAWALVPIEYKRWWIWFCLHLRQAFNIDTKDDFAFTVKKVRHRILLLANQLWIGGKGVFTYSEGSMQGQQYTGMTGHLNNMLYHSVCVWFLSVLTATPTVLIVTRRPMALPIRLRCLRLGHRSLRDICRIVEVAVVIKLTSTQSLRPPCSVEGRLVSAKFLRGRPRSFRASKSESMELPHIYTNRGPLNIEDNYRNLKFTVSTS